jgi:hypothetical protein
MNESTAKDKKLVVFLALWEHHRKWFFHDGERVPVEKIEDARKFAAKHGFDGICIRPV